MGGRAFETWCGVMALNVLPVARALAALVRVRIVAFGHVICTHTRIIPGGHVC